MVTMGSDTGPAASLEAKFTAFASGLTPDETALFEAAVDGATRDEVAGFDAQKPAPPPGLMTTILTNIANMKHESLKGIAQNLRG